jgi:hypothetical protein
MSVDLATILHGEARPGTLPEHVSFSQVELMSRCAEAWRQRYLVGTRGPATTALAVGSGVHSGIAELYDQLCANPKISKKTLVKRAIETATTTLANIDYAGADTLDDITTTTQHLLEVYATERPTHIKPVATEQEIRVDLPDTDIYLKGYIDVVAETSLVEIKTSGKKVTVPTGAWKVQAWLYQAAIPRQVEYHVLVKSATPILITSAALAVQYDAAKTKSAISLASATLERIQQLYEQRGPDEEWPTTGVLHPWACGSCDARHTCSVGGIA